MCKKMISEFLGYCPGCAVGWKLRKGHFYVISVFPVIFAEKNETFIVND